MRTEEQKTVKVYMDEDDKEMIDNGGIVKVDVDGHTVEIGYEPDMFNEEEDEEPEIWQGYPKPDVGDVLVDPERGHADVTVTEVTNTPANQYVIRERDMTAPWEDKEVTVADENGNPMNRSPVVLATYSGSDEEYAFPISRLNP